MKNKIISIKLTFLVVAFFASPIFLNAQAPGSLDLSFDTDGKVTTNFGVGNEGINSVAIQSDGKIVVVGQLSTSSGTTFALARYNTNGSLDTTFDNDGKVTTDFGPGNEFANSVAIQSDGKIVVAGVANTANQVVALARYNIDGSLDSTFDNDGILTTNIGPYADGARSIVIQNNGKIVVAGHASSLTNLIDFAIICYNTNGSLDSTFDNDGIVTTDIGIDNEFGYSLALQSDGKIVVAGGKGTSSNNDIAVMRFNVNGSLDSTFDNDGKLTTDIFGYNDVAYAVSIQSDGKIVVAGYSTNTPLNSDFALVRYNTNGSLDSTFDNDGIVTTDITGFNNGDEIKSLAIRPDGRIMVAGFSKNSATSIDFALAAYNTNGSLDNNFDTDGIVTTSFGASDDVGNAIAIQDDDKIVVAGNSVNASSQVDFAIARYYGFNTTVGIETIDNHIPEIQIYPNPFSVCATLHSNIRFNNASLTIYNLLGQEMKRLNKLSGETITLNRGSLLSGLYFVKLEQDNRIIFQNKLIITD